MILIGIHVWIQESLFVVFVSILGIVLSLGEVRNKMLWLEAEYKALRYASCEAMWLIHLLHDLGLRNLSYATLYSDSKSSITFAHNPVLHE